MNDVLRIFIVISHIDKIGFGKDQLYILVFCVTKC